MRKLQLILAYYTLLVSLGLFLWAIFLGPKPTSLFIAGAMIPIGIYFWIILLGKSKIKAVEYPREAKSEESLAKSALAILAVIFISASSMFTYSFINTKLLNPQDQIPSEIASKLSLIEQKLEKSSDINAQTKEEIIDEINDLKQKKNAINNNLDSESLLTNVDRAKLLGASDSKVMKVTIKNRDYQEVNVYKEKNSSSEVVGKAVFGKSYTAINKENDWYLILFTDGIDTTEGYINSQFVIETEI